MLDTGRVLVEVVGTPIASEHYLEYVSDPGAGALSTFVGVTRDNFAGKAVVHLEYEAYVPMAERQLAKLGEQMMAKWDLIKVAIGHRTGTVAVKEPSVIIAVSSAHRRESLEAVHWCIDELKAVVPIWKKERYSDGETWKENAESRRLYMEGAGTWPKHPSQSLLTSTVTVQVNVAHAMAAACVAGLCVVVGAPLLKTLSTR